jgi:outer membrane protein
MVNSQVKQAQYNFVGASEQLESAHRSVVQTVRSSFNNVNASISSINAYKQAVVSAQSSLDAMEAGYSVGTRTIVDVLDATTTLYNAKQQLSSARYNYLINQLNIKSALGTLNEQDLVALNNTLGKPISDLAGQRRAGKSAAGCRADGYSNTAAAKPASARSTSGSNPFRQ